MPNPEQERLLVQLATVSAKLEHVATSLESHSTKLDRLVELQQQTAIVMSRLEDRSAANRADVEALQKKERLRGEEAKDLKRRIADLEKEFSKRIDAEMKARNAVRTAIASALASIGMAVASYLAK